MNSKPVEDDSFLDITPCSVEVYRRFKGAYSIIRARNHVDTHVQDHTALTATIVVSSSRDFSSLFNHQI
jgi:hypothetical protein